LNAGWDEELLRGLLSELREDEFDLDVLGFSDEELNALLAEPPDLAEGLTDEDAVPEPLEEPVSRRGDLWILGAHRLLCGDSANREDVDRLVAGETVDLVNTDPPYNVRVEPRSNNAIAAGLSSFGGLQHHQRFDLHRGASKAKRTTQKLRPKDRALANDFLKDADYDVLLRRWFSNLAAVLKPGGAFYIWGGYSNCANYPVAMADCGLYFSQAIIWVKEHPVLTRKDFMSNHEWAFYGWREGAAHWFNPEIKNATDVWVVKKVHPVAMVHLTEKPVELAVRALTYSSRPGEVVLDLFGGSGSTLIAAEKLGRRARLMEIDPAYVDVIVRRWQEFTGQKAVLDDDGRGFGEIADERRGLPA
jgi:DNA modification methylase